MHEHEPEAALDDRDRADFAAAFAIGAALGAGAVLLLRPASRPKGTRIAPGVTVGRKRVRGSARRLQKSHRGTAQEAAGLREQIGAAGRSAAAELRDEIAAAARSARKELARAIGEQVADAKERFERSSERLR